MCTESFGIQTVLVDAGCCVMFISLTVNEVLTSCLLCCSIPEPQCTDFAEGPPHQRCEQEAGQWTRRQSGCHESCILQLHQLGQAAQARDPISFQAQHNRSEQCRELWQDVDRTVPHRFPGWDANQFRLHFQWLLILHTSHACQLQAAITKPLSGNTRTEMNQCSDSVWVAGQSTLFVCCNRHHGEGSWGLHVVSDLILVCKSDNFCSWHVCLVLILPILLSLVL